MSDDSYRFECPSCGQHISATRELAGSTAACPTCNTSFVVPAPRVSSGPVPEPPRTRNPLLVPLIVVSVLLVGTVAIIGLVLLSAAQTPPPQVRTTRFLASTSATTLPARPPESSPAETTKPDCEIVSVDARVTEANNVWSKYAWKLRLRNNRSTAISVAATIQFRDADSFVVDEAGGRDLVVPAKEEKVFTGYKLITASAADKVKEVQATLADR